MAGANPGQINPFRWRVLLQCWVQGQPIGPKEDSMRYKRWLSLLILITAMTTSIASAGFSAWAGMEGIQAPCLPQVCNGK